MINPTQVPENGNAPAAVPQSQKPPAILTLSADLARLLRRHSKDRRDVQEANMLLCFINLRMTKFNK